MTTEIIKPIKIEKEMRDSYLDYAMSVIVSRALPDIRDGLKPVQRRILYAMHELGMRSNTPYKKSARLVGEVLGKYHPHGDVPVYDAMVRMAQEFSMRYPLIDGQGNFGSMDNDPPAAMRYTEARMAAIAEEMLVNIEQNTVDFTPNFDGSLNEPTVLPARLPNLLINGSAGIAVGMATNIPPHNLGEVCSAIAYLIENPDASVDELMQFIQGPDFPTGAILQGREGIRSAYTTGRGRVVVKARAIIEEPARGSRRQIIISELPYQINKAALVERIADLAKDRKIEGISDIRDESDREGLRVVIELKREAQAGHVLNALYKHTAMQSTFSINMLALVDGQPRVLDLKTALELFIRFRETVIQRRSEFELGKARDRAHILEGLKKALDALDAVIATIRQSSDAEVARTRLMQRFALSQLQAQAILDMQLRRLAALEREKILKEYEEVVAQIASLEDLLAHPEKIRALVKEETEALSKDYGDDRRTEISKEEWRQYTTEELVPHGDMVITLSQGGYIKRIPADVYKTQRRGGKGVISVVNRREDEVQHLLVADTHDLVLFFTTLGDRARFYLLKCYDLPEERSRTAKGMPMVNLLPSLEEEEKVTAILSVPNMREDCYLVMATRRGGIKRTPLSAFASARSRGIAAMKLKKGDELVSAKVMMPGEEIILVTRKGLSSVFLGDQVTSHSRAAGGIRGMRLMPGDEVVAMDTTGGGTHLLVISEKGRCKLTSLEKYSRHNRGVKGVGTLRVTFKTGEVAAAEVVDPSQELMIVSAKGKLIRIDLGDVSIQGRNTTGVATQEMEPDDSVASIACLKRSNTRLIPGGS